MIVFFGGGVMAEAIVRGLLAAGFERDQLAVVEQRPERCAELAAAHGVRTAAVLREVADPAALLVLAVKPQNVPNVIATVAEHPPRLLVSICAGITTAYLESRLGELPVIRTMPNTPALVGCGVTALCRGRFATAEQLAEARRIFAAVGETVIIPDEQLMNAVTAVSGSGPAYLFAFARDLLAGARAFGLDAATAQTLVQQTLHGAIQLWLETGATPDELMARVTSKRGTTEAALNLLTQLGWSFALHEAMVAAEKRAAELAAGGN